MATKYFSQVFANSGDLSAVPDAIDPAGGLSYAAGFNANFSRNLASDPLAKAVPRAQFNQIMQDVTGAIQQLQQMGTPVWISSSMNDGTPYAYAAYARVLYTDGHVYESLVGSNTVTPTNDGINWHLVDASSASAFSTGDVKLTMKTVADAGWVMCQDGTIGSASSPATTRANADTLALYTLLWNNVSNSYAPVSSGRGISAAADFAANKTLQLTAMLGRAIAISGNGSGLSVYALGQSVGENTHVLTVSEMPSHNHTITDPGHNHYYNYGGNAWNQGPYGSASSNANGNVTTTSGTGISINANGGGSAHNNMQPTAFLNAMIKL